MSSVSLARFSAVTASVARASPAQLSPLVSNTPEFLVIDDVKQLKQLRGIVPRLLPRPHGGSRFQGASIARSNKSGLPRPKG